MKIILSLICLSYLINSNAQTSFFVTPFSTNSNYDINQDSSLVDYNSNLSNGKLVLFLGGTNSNTDNYTALKNKIVDLGYKFINLSYPNTVPAASLSNNTNALAFDEYRQEICYGTPLSNTVSVDSLNSIHTRFNYLLTYLNSTYPTQNWGNYLNSNTSINWDNIIVAGHSQGSGHAAYLAKSNAVDRVLMFSGLNDYSDFFSCPGNWLNEVSVTPTTKFYSYLSLLDEVVNYEKQYLNALSIGVPGDSIHVDNVTAPFNNSHNLYTTQAPGFVILNHSSPVKFSLKNHEVWTYMLTNNPTNKLEEFNLTALTIYPNPTRDIIHINYPNLGLNTSYSIYSLDGKEVKFGKIQTNEIQIKDLNPGTYLLSINKQLTRQFIVK